ncbi:hypothetical protein V1504DRAFT_501017 [Lipomyces starkeyi]
MQLCDWDTGHPEDEQWMRILGEESPLDRIQLNKAWPPQPSSSGQSIEKPVVSSVISRQVVREIAEVYAEVSNGRILPVASETFQLLHDLRSSSSGNNIESRRFASSHTANRIWEVRYYIRIDPERRRGRITLLVMPFVALKYDLEERAKKLGVNAIRWSSTVTNASITMADIVVSSVENLESGRFRQQFTELLIGKHGHSFIARFFIDEAHTILGHWDFRPSFQALSDLTSFSVPLVLLSATVPPNKVNDICRVYNRPDLRLFRAPSTMRPNIKYEVSWLSSAMIKEKLRDQVFEFMENARPGDRVLYICG